MKTIVEFYICHESGLTCVRRVWKLYGLTIWSKEYGLGYHENIRRAFIDNGQHSEKADQVIIDRCRWTECDPDGATPFTWKGECGLSWHNGEDAHALYSGRCGVCGKLIMPIPFNKVADGNEAYTMMAGEGPIDADEVDWPIRENATGKIVAVAKTPQFQRKLYDLLNKKEKL